MICLHNGPIGQVQGVLHTGVEWIFQSLFIDMLIKMFPFYTQFTKWWDSLFIDRFSSEPNVCQSLFALPIELCQHAVYWTLTQP